MTNKLVVIIKSLKVPKIKKILLYEMKFLVPIYICLQNPRLGGYCSQIPVLSVLCPQLNLLNAPRNKIPGYTTALVYCLTQWNNYFCPAALQVIKAINIVFACEGWAQDFFEAGEFLSPLCALSFCLWVIL